MARFLIGVGVVALFIVMWMLAVQLGTTLGEGLRQVLP